MRGKSNTAGTCDAADFAGLAVDEETKTETSWARPLDPIRDFLIALFGVKPAELFILVWLLGDKCSRWFPNISDAVAYVEGFAGEDVYVGGALSPEDFGPSRRCKADAAAAITAFWMDLDYQDEAHKKKNLPATARDALDLIPGDMRPNIVVHSGHGIQVWWVFEKPWIFMDDEDRAAAAALADAWKLVVKRRAAAKGLDIDSVADLARVMRVPGTTNTKVQSDHRPVKIIDMNGRRYDPEEFRAYIERNLTPSVAVAPRADAGDAPAQPRPPVDPGQPTVIRDIVLNPGAAPPFEKFELLCEVESKFRESWQNKRPDLQDQSPSAFDLSLANFAARFNWSDQEISDLLIAHRRKHGHDLKLRLDYVRKTIQRARAGADQYLREQEADAVLTTLLDSAAVAATDRVEGGEAETAGVSNLQGLDAEGKRKLIIETLTTKFNIPIKRIIKFTGDDPQYRLETGLGNVQLGNVNGLIVQGRLRSSIAATTGLYLPHFERHWPQLASLLLQACVEVDRGEDATLAGTMTEWLRAYLNHKTPHDSIKEAAEGREPFRDDGAVHIFVSDLKRWLGIALGEKVTQNQLTSDLRAFGAEPQFFNVDIDKKPTTRSAWKLPLGVWEKPAEQPNS